VTAPVRDQAWRNRAACASSAPWFDDVIDGETAEARAARLAAAVQVCERCPVVESCRADRRPHELGVWGGQLYSRDKQHFGRALRRVVVTDRQEFRRLIAAGVDPDMAALLAPVGARLRSGTEAAS
jgi:hypothetical protein